MFRICWGRLILPNCPEMSCNSNWRQQMTRRLVDAWTQSQSGEMQMLPHVFVNVCGSAKFNFAHSTVHLSRICAPLWNAVWQPGWRGCVGFMAEGARGPLQHFYIPVLGEIWKARSQGRFIMHNLVCQSHSKKRLLSFSFTNDKHLHLHKEPVRHWVSTVVWICLLVLLGNCQYRFRVKFKKKNIILHFC